MQNGLEGYGNFLCGSKDALEGTVVAYNKRLIYYIGGIVSDLQQAEDLAADTFVQLIVKKPVFHSEEQLCTWLYKVARNLAFDCLKKRKKDALPLEDAENLGDGRELLSAVLDSEDKRQVHTALAELCDDYRSVLILLYFEGLSYDGISKIMHKSEKQIKNLAYRARQSMKEKLERMGYIYEER